MNGVERLDPAPNQYREEMSMRLKLTTALTALVLFAGCQKEAEAPAPAASEPTSVVAAAPATEAPAAAATEVAGFGVAECDAYLQKMLDCIDTRVPEAAREQFRSSLQASRSAWEQAAATQEGKAGLAMACTQATEAAKLSMGAYGCGF
jgi:hypothetical protein